MTSYGVRYIILYMRGKPFIKGQIPWNYNKIELKCEFCGNLFKVPPSRKDTAKHCSRKCHNTANSRLHDISMENNPMWKGGIQIYRRYKKSACERCNSVKYLIVHHIDRNRYNNVISNLETLCRSCHAKEHNAIEHLISSDQQ